MKLNNKGQTLIMFIILLPILIGIIAFVVDYGVIVYEKDKLSNLIELSINENKNIDKILKINDIKNYKKEEKENCYKITYYKKSLFGNVVGIKEYKITASSCS